MYVFKDEFRCGGLAVVSTLLASLPMHYLCVVKFQFLGRLLKSRQHPTFMHLVASFLHTLKACACVPCNHATHRKQLLPEEWDYPTWKETHLAKWLSRSKHCFVSVCFLPSRGMLKFDEGDWDYQNFLDHELGPYLEMTKEFMEEEFPNA